MREIDLDADLAALDEPAPILVGAGDGDDDAAPALSPPPVQIAADHAAPMTIDAFRAAVVADLADRMAMFAQHRVERPLAVKPSREERLLAQLDAIVATGRRARADLLAWWAKALPEQPWSLWAVLFTLTSLPGPEGLILALDLVEALPDDDAERARIATEALLVAPHPGMDALLRDLLASPRAAARAVGIEVASRRRAVPLDRLTRTLDEADPLPLAAAIRAVARAPEIRAVPEPIRAELRNPDRGVVWEATRAIARAHPREALEFVRDGGPIADALGPLVVEIFVMTGGIQDAPALGRLARRYPMTPALLDGLGRFGHAGAWAYLAHGLAEAELADAAAAALRTIFGDLVPSEAAFEASAWRAAIARGHFDESKRLRGGAPWTAAAVVGECLSGALPRPAVERRLDELRARTGIDAPCDLGLWTPDLEPQLSALSAAYGRA